MSAVTIYSDEVWRDNAKFGLYGVREDDATAEWDAWLAERDRRIKAEALREASRELWGQWWITEEIRPRRSCTSVTSWMNGASDGVGWTCRKLDARADSIEAP